MDRGRLAPLVLELRLPPHLRARIVYRYGERLPERQEFEKPEGFRFGAIHLRGDNCTVTGNLVTGNEVGIRVTSSNAVLTENTVSSNSCGGIWLVGAHAVTVDGNIIDSNEREGGIYIDYVFDTTIRNNTVSNNSYAIFLEDWGDDSNVVYLNTFANNEPDPLWCEHLSWQSPDPVTYTYNGQSFTSPLGNYWGNYTGTDGDGDGIGDTPYAISASAQDPYPLMGAWQDGSISPPAGSTAIKITSPWDDAVTAGGNVTVAGNVSDTAITSLTLTHNGVSSTIPVEDGNFSAEATLADANTITLSGTDSLGNPFSTTLLLDGDMLPAAYEQEIGFDPLDADSDCSQWSGDQSGNGVIDGYEIFAGDLPVFAKARIGADPFVVDTDGDGHADFEAWNDPDYDPLVYEERYGPLEMGREFLLGAVLGEWGADDHDNLFYLGGWVASGVIVIGDLRDIAATISWGDLIGTGLNLAALIPAYGDAAKAAEVVGKFVLKHPELLKPAMVLLISEILGPGVRTVAGASHEGAKAVWMLVPFAFIAPDGVRVPDVPSGAARGFAFSKASGRLASRTREMEIVWSRPR